MPRYTTGSVFRAGDGYGVRWPENGRRPQRVGFRTKTEARRWFAENVAPRLESGAPAPMADLTLAGFVDVFLERHAATVRPKTIDALRWRLGVATTAFGNVSLRDLQHMSGEVATWKAKLPPRSRFGIVAALRQALGAAVRWGYMGQNPAVLAGRNSQPAPRPVRTYTVEEVAAIAGELAPTYRPLPMFAAATGLRPEEWIALERRDVDRQGEIVSVRRTVSSGEIVELGKTTRSRRQVPLSPRASDALDQLTPRLDTPYLFPAPAGGVLNLDNWRRRVWAPAIEAAGVQRPARIYDLRSTFASNALAAGVSVFELARIMGTSMQMIELHYGTLIEGAGADIARRLGMFEADQDVVAERSGVLVASDPD